ncbi:MAG TPA: lamin tail domain-containing protein [Pyrinomonadaceae bacterium]|nr:lamin tail domain-containing protein [Pyrinomonadaceae bacterium]
MRFTLRLSVLACVALACAGAYLSVERGSRAQTQPGGSVIISELRYRGPDGIRDEYVELYNNTNAPITVQASDASGGWGLAASNGSVAGTFCVIPNGTVIPARGHFLCANTDPDFGSGYSLNDYPSGNPTPTPTPTPNPSAAPVPAGTFATARPDRAYTLFDDIPDGFGIALFTSANTPNQNAATRLDAFGFTNSPALFREGAGFPTVPSTSNEHVIFRDLRSTVPQDTNNNAADFRFGATTGSIQSQLNVSPGPENLASPIVNNTTISVNLLDPTVAGANPPNRLRIQTPETNAPLGTIIIRRTFTNNTGSAVTRLRFRVTNITTRGTPNSECGGAPCADVRALTSDDGTATLNNQTVVVVRGVDLEENPPITPEGGGLNSSLSANFITLATPLQNGFSVNIQFKLGVVRSGPFRFFINVEAQNAPIILNSAARGR